MNVLSLFNGMSIGRLALEKCNIEVENYFTSEIKETAIKLCNHKWGKDISTKLGDVCKIKAQQLPQIDLLIGGSPCQDLSIAMKDREGLKGIKSKLFFEFLRLLKETKPKYFLLENVGSMRKSDKDIISNLVGVEPIMIDAKLVSAQNRKRYYWTNIPGVKQPTDKKIKLNDILKDGWSNLEKAKCLTESGSRPLRTSFKMMHRYMTTGMTTLIFKNETQYNSCINHYNSWFKGLSAKLIDNSVKYMDIDLKIYDGLRYLYQSELEELQCVPKGYTEILTRDQSAGLLGDGWNVDVIAHIFKNIKLINSEVDAAQYKANMN